MKGDKGNMLAGMEAMDMQAFSGDDVDSKDALQRMQQMMSRMEGNLIRRICQVEGAIQRVGGLEEDVSVLKVKMEKALLPQDPPISHTDV